MPKKTLNEIAKANGLTRAQLDAAKTNGVNVWDPRELEKWMETRRPRVAKSAQLSEGFGDEELPTLESIEAELLRAKTHEDVKILQGKIAGLKTAMQVRQEMRELVPIGEVDERDTRIAAAMKAAVLRLCNDAAPHVEGLEAAKAH